jgi:ubiquinone biosynthesis O-methyltransferase
MIPRHIYEKFHQKTTFQEKVINVKNFTYRIILGVINNHISNFSNKAILDVGCGAGTISLYLANKEANIIGVDISRKAIDSCKKSAKALKLKNKTQFICNTIEKVKFRRKFDLIICSEIIEHIPNDKAFLKRIHKLLENNGLLILSTPSINAPLYKIGLAQNFDKRVGHIRRYSKKQISDLVKNSGFTIEKVRLTEGVLRNFFFLTRFGWFIKFFRGIISDIVTVMDNLLIRLFGESQIFIVARK